MQKNDARWWEDPDVDDEIKTKEIFKKRERSERDFNRNLEIRRQQRQTRESEI